MKKTAYKLPTVEIIYFVDDGIIICSGYQDDITPVNELAPIENIVEKL